jgi:di/tricarboxylate transporter
MVDAIGISSFFSLWIFGGALSIDATTTAFIGLTLLLLTSVLTWEDVKGEKEHGIPSFGLPFW